MTFDSQRHAVLWLLDGKQACVELAAFGCETDPDETAAQYIARVTGLKVTVSTISHITAEPSK